MRLIYRGSAVVTPPQLALGTGTTLLSGPSQQTTTFTASTGNGFTPTSGDVLVRMFYRPNGTVTLPITVRIGGVTVTQRASANGGNGGEAGVWMGTVRGLGTGTALDVTVTSAGTGGGAIGRIVLRCTNLLNWTGGLGVVTTPVIVQGATNVLQVSVSGAATSASGILLGVAGVVDADCSPLAANTGWDLSAQGTVSSGAGTSAAVGFAYRGSPGAGVSATLTVSSATAWTDWAATFLELV